MTKDEAATILRNAAWLGNDADREKVEEAIEVLAEQKTGKWIKMSDADGTYYCCSECGEELYREWTFDTQFELFPIRTSIAKTKYCPNCGARMEA